jgi:hypothetical protein
VTAAAAAGLGACGVYMRIIVYSFAVSLYDVCVSPMSECDVCVNAVVDLLTRICIAVAAEIAHVRPRLRPLPAKRACKFNKSIKPRLVPAIRRACKFYIIHENDD